MSGLAYDPVRDAVAAGHSLGVAFFSRRANGNVAPLFALDVPGSNGLYATGGLTFLP